MENTKNLLIRTSSDKINYFKEKGWQYYSENKKFFLFTYKNYLINTLLNLESNFEKKYGTLILPDKNYLIFYKKRGINKKGYLKEETIEKINFNLSIEHIELYYKLMHNYYINECPTESNYSVSHFFSFIIEYLKKRKLKFYYPEDAS